MQKSSNNPNDRKLKSSNKLSKTSNDRTAKHLPYEN